MARTVARMRSSWAGRKPTIGSTQQGGVEFVRTVGLGEAAPLVDGVLADVRVDEFRLAPPRLGQPLLAAQRRQSRAAVERDPAHDLGEGEVSRLAADLPDAAVGLAPGLQRGVHRLDDDAPRPLAERVARAGVLEDAVDDGAEDVELVLVAGAVADPHGLAPDVAREVIELDLGLRVAAVHGVEHLEVAPGTEAAPRAAPVVRARRRGRPGSRSPRCRSPARAGRAT